MNTVGQTVFDGLGHKTQSQLSESGGTTIYTDTAYDGLERVASVSNPYRTTGDSTYGVTATAYDAVDRPWKVTYPDKSVEYTGYQGNVVTHADPKPVCRQTVTDSLGRLTKLTENPTLSGIALADGSTMPSCTPASGEIHDIATQYGYDGLDDLLSVNQAGTLNRTFVYDTLKRLASATNPESGLIQYAYDNNGNVISVTDNRNVTKCFGTLSGSSCQATGGYDALNRPLQKNYYIPNNSVAAPTPAVTYVYDTVFVGQLSSVTATGSTGVQTETTYTSYNPMGRVTKSTQTTDGIQYPFNYAYNLGGQLETEGFPSGRTLTYCYDGAGRIASVNGATAYATVPALDSATNTYGYAPHGELQEVQLGNGLDEWHDFSNRLQNTDVRLGTAGASPQWSIVNTYPASPNNNGNLASQRIGTVNQTQSYTYDSWNRLTGVSGETGWQHGYGYDAFGNRTLTSGSNVLANPVTLTPKPTATFPNNRWTPALADGAVWYDLAGNGQGLPDGSVYTYDAENRLATAGTSQYFYDGDGHRTKKITASGTTTYVYDAAGELTAEYESGGSTKLSSVRMYLTADHLGSTRVVTTSGGQIEQCFDYLPFGEELPSDWGARSSVACYNAPGQTTDMLFTGKERGDANTEGGLDYFGARYFSSAQGRFTSVDPIQYSKGRLVDPQQWNMYAYARGNPLRWYDPTGAYNTTCKSKDITECSQDIQNFEAPAAKRPPLQEWTRSEGCCCLWLF